VLGICSFVGQVGVFVCKDCVALGAIRVQLLLMLGVHGVLEQLLCEELPEVRCLVGCEISDGV
jgi:hypothetical protein